MYHRISSVQSTFDFKYHTDQYENLEGSFIVKLVYFPYSYIANDVLEACIKDADKKYSLQRLGMTMHVFANRFAHQGFADKLHNINKIDDLILVNEGQSFFNKAKAANEFPMGHRPALECQDKPYQE
jgi:hypothetical protein